LATGTNEVIKARRGALVGTDMNATAALARACYSGMYGTCHQCDLAGSCMCGTSKSGHSDMITMDQTRWGGIIYVCATYDPYITVAWAINICLACINSYLCMARCKTHWLKALKKKQRPLGNRIVRIFGLLSTSSVSLLGLSVAKVASVSSLIGIDFVPSLFFSLHCVLLMVVLASHAIHLTEGALSTQESTLGRTRIREAVAREARYMLLLCGFCSPFTAVPMLGAVTVVAGLHSETFEQIQLLLFNGGVVLTLVLLLLSLSFGSRRMNKSVAQSIAALKGSLAIAGGGVSAMAEQARGAYGTPAEKQYRPADLQVIDDELEKLERMQRKVQTSTKKILLGGSFVILMLIIPSCMPYAWNRFSYIFPINLAVGQIAYTYQVVASFAPAKHASPAVPAASSVATATANLMRPATQSV